MHSNAYLIVIKFCNIFLANGVNEEGRGEGEEGEERPGCNDDSQVAAGRVGIQDRLAS